MENQALLLHMVFFGGEGGGGYILCIALSSSYQTINQPKRLQRKNWITSDNHVLHLNLRLLIYILRYAWTLLWFTGHTSMQFVSKSRLTTMRHAHFGTFKLASVTKALHSTWAPDRILSKLSISCLISTRHSRTRRGDFDTQSTVPWPDVTKLSSVTLVESWVILCLPLVRASAAWWSYAI